MVTRSDLLPYIDNSNNIHMAFFIFCWSDSNTLTYLIAVFLLLIHNNVHKDLTTPFDFLRLFTRQKASHLMKRTVIYGVVVLSAPPRKQVFSSQFKKCIFFFYQPRIWLRHKIPKIDKRYSYMYHIDNKDLDGYKMITFLFKFLLLIQIHDYGKLTTCCT